MTSPESGPVQPARSGLREHFLTRVEVAGQSIANDGPSLAIAVGVGLVAVNAGAGATVVFIAATAAIVLVGLNIGYVASRLASAGSLYEYVRSAIGPASGFATGWVQLLGYSTFLGIESNNRGGLEPCRTLTPDQVGGLNSVRDGLGR